MAVRLANLAVDDAVLDVPSLTHWLPDLTHVLPLALHCIANAIFQIDMKLLPLLRLHLLLSLKTMMVRPKLMTATEWMRTPPLRKVRRRAVL